MPLAKNLGKVGNTVFYIDGEVITRLLGKQAGLEKPNLFVGVQHLLALFIPGKFPRVKIAALVVEDIESDLLGPGYTESGRGAVQSTRSPVPSGEMRWMSCVERRT